VSARAALAALLLIATSGSLAPTPAAAATPQAAASSPEVKAPAAAPAVLANAAQLRARLDAERGRVLILNLWGTWCVPCLREIPDLIEVERRLTARGVRLLGLGMDEPSQRATLVEPFRAKHFPGFETLLRNEPDMDTLVSVVDPAWNEILPTTYLIGRDGKVFKKIQGRRSIDEFIALLEPAL
jgi:thiol-disulfide isomerase/thioredoxin